MDEKALVVLSGGQDSTTCLFWAKENFSSVKAVSFNYGQRHAVELDAARKVSLLANVKHEVIDVPNILRGRSPLTNKNETLETYSDFNTMDKIIGDRVELTFVPMRNPFFLTLAANIAVTEDIFDLVTGVCQQDDANYPDCRLDFIVAQEFAINKALGIKKFRIHTPLMDLTKAQTVKLARTLPGCWGALAYTHTCYAGKVPPCIMTEKTACHACTLRAEGFRQAAELDPLIVRFQGALVSS